MKLTINGAKYEVDVEPEMPLLWVIRDEIGLTGTKFGCGIGMCGACSIHMDGQLVRSCIVPASSVEGRTITTIEGLLEKGVELQRAWIDLQVPQCGYCQSGMLMSAADLLNHNAHPDDAAIDAAMTNICRCGTYSRIREAIHRVVSEGESLSARKKIAQTEIKRSRHGGRS
jgi:isoquinoline 1-oxidoreductase subunit alpha